MEENLCPNLTPEINAPLSPVLTSNKKNRKIIRKIKLMNKIGVCTFESKSRTPSPLIDENSQTFNTETPENIVKFQKDTPNSELVERIRKINELKNTKKVFYDTTEDTQCTLSSVIKPVDYESINTKNENLVTVVPKTIEASPKSPTERSEATKDPIAKIEIPLRNFELPLEQKFNKFTSVSGKKIVISDRSLSRATKIFDDIFLEQNGTLQNSNCILNQTLGDKIGSDFEMIAPKKVDLLQNFGSSKKFQNRTLEAKIGFDLENTKEKEKKDFLAPKSVETKFFKKGKGVTFSKTDDLNFTMDQNFDYLNKNLTQIINEKVGNETSENIQDLTLISRELENNPILSQESSKFSPYTPDEIEFKKPIFKNPSTKTKMQNFAPETQCVDPEFLGKLNFSQWIDSPKKNPNIDLFTQDDFVYCTEVVVDKIECDQFFKGFDISEQDQIYEKLFFFKKFIEIFNSNQKKKILYPLSITFYDVKEKLEGRNYALRHRKNSNGVVAPRRGRKRKRRSSVSATKVYGAQNLQLDELSSQYEDLSSQIVDLPSQNEKFLSENVEILSQKEDLSIQYETFSSQNGEISSQNEDLSSQNAQFLKPNERFLEPNEKFLCPNEKYLNQDKNFSQNERYFGENVEILNPNNKNSNRNPKGPFSRTVKIDSEMKMGPNELKIGFSTASGKLLTVSTETMEKIGNFFENIDFGNTESTFKELDPLEVRHPDNRTIKNSFVNQRETFEKSSIENSETENSETSVIATKSPEIDSKSSKRSKISSKGSEMSSESSKLSQKSSEFNQNISQLSQESADLSQKKFGFVKNDSDSSSQQFLELLSKSSSSSQKESNSQNSSSLSQKSKYAQDFLSSDSQNSQKDSEKSLESTQSASHFKQESNKSESQNMSGKYSEPVPSNENKSSKGNFGFATASGKKIGLSKSALNKAQNIFKDLESFQHVSNSKDLSEEKISVANFDNRKNSSELEENISKIKSAEELFLETLEKDFSQKDQQKAPFVPNPEKSSMVSPETSFGFSSASGKKLGLSETALKQAQNMFKDLDSSENVPTPEKSTKGPPETSFGFSSTSGKKLRLSETALKKAQNMFKDLDSLENIPTAEKSIGGPTETSFGFSSASGKKLGLSETALKKAQNMFKDLDSLENNPPPEKSTGGPPDTSFGFSSASGKKLGLSETALKKAQNMFKDLDSLKNVPTPEKSTRSPPETNFGFSNASGKKLQLSESAIKKAQNLFNNLQDIETPKTTPNYKKVSSKPTFKSPLIENPALVSNSKITPKGALSRKRSLGVSSLRNFDISEEKLKRARLIFEDIGNQNNSPKINVFKKNLGSNESPYREPNLANFDTPKTSKPIGNSNFQNMDSPDPKNLQKESKIPKVDVTSEFSDKNFAVDNSDNLKDTSLNLDDFEKHFLNDDFEKSPEKSFLTFSKKINSTKNFEFDMVKKIEDLKSQMEILEERMKIFKVQQEKSKENKKITRPKPGQLFLIKTDPKNLQKRISLKNFVNDALPGTHRMKLAKNITEITPRNALNIQFWIPWDTKNLLQLPILPVKGENSKIIPTAENFIGFYEIGEAFKSMDGVNPKLISENWIENHFKWIVWKLASSERSFPKQFENYLTPENIISQLKYRYDREIDNVQRSALKKIYEMDDSPAKRLVLCVSDIFKNGDQNFDLELTDGWYSIRTIIDSPLSKMVEKNLIKIGTKLIFYGAELQNCQGCSPLEDISGVRLKISYNSTRRAAWYVKLGYYKFQSPFLVSLKSIHHNGGLTSFTKGYIARIYPLTYMEKNFTAEKKSEEKTEIVSWHNDKAEVKKIEIWERNRNSFIEKLQSQLEKEFRNDSNKKRRSSRNPKEKIENVTCPKVLYEMMENSADPEMFKEMMSPSQCRSVLDYQATVSFEKQSILNEKMKERLSEAKFDKRNVSPVLKIMLVDPNFTEHHRNLSIWYPNENYLDLKEGCVINLYNVVPRSNGQISSTKNMHIEIDKNFSNGEKFETFQRNVTPIKTILESNFKPIFNEFDTIGILINLELKENQQNFWICDEKNRYLSITILNSQENCVLLEGYKIGEILAIQNLIYRKSNSDFGQAFGTLTTVITKKPQKTYLKNYLEDFKKKLPENLDEYVEHCQNGVEVHLAQILLEFNELQPFSLEEFNSKNKEKTKKILNSEELTLSDEEMLLIEDIV